MEMRPHQRYIRFSTVLSGSDGDNSFEGAELFILMPCHALPFGCVDLGEGDTNNEKIALFAR